MSPYESPTTPVAYCGWYADVDIQADARSAAFFGSYAPACLAIVFLSTPRLRKQWAFRILVFALVCAMSKDMLGLNVSVRLYGA